MSNLFIRRKSLARTPGRRALRRATTPSPRQRARTVGRLKAAAARQISEGLKEKLMARDKHEAS